MIEGDRTSLLPADGSPLTLARQQFILIDGDRELTTNSPIYTLQFAEVPSWVTDVKITGDLSQEETTSFRSFDAQSKAVGITLNGGDGPKIINVQFKGDGCLLSDDFQVIVHLDTQAPILVDLALPQSKDSDAGRVTTAAEQTLQIQLVGAAEVMLTGEDVVTVGGVPNEGNWLPTLNESTLSLAVGLNDETDGPKVIAVQARDRAENLTATQTITVTLDRVPPTDGAIVILDPVPIDHELGRVNLSVSANGASEMQISTSEAFVDAQWQPYANSERSLVLDAPSEDGLKRIFTRFRDAAGNVRK